MFNFFKRKRRATLKDKDEMTMFEVESFGNEEPINLSSMHDIRTK